jgi:hypothetical protein
MKKFAITMLSAMSPIFALPNARDAELSGLPPWMYWGLVFIAVCVYTAMRNRKK